MSNDPNQPNQPYYPPPSSPYETSPYGQPYYPPSPSGQPEQSAYPPPPPTEKTELAYPPTYGTPPVQSSYQQSAYGVPSYTQPPAKKSRRWLWIILGIVGLVVVLIVGGIIGLVVLISHSPATDAVNSYYSAIKSQNYSQAYSYLDPTLKLRDAAQTPLTQDIFVQGLQQVDQQKGKVSNYSITSTSLNTSNGTSSGTYTVSVTRNGTTYDVHLVLQQENGQWKITSFDTV